MTAKRHETGRLIYDFFDAEITERARSRRATT